MKPIIIVVVALIVISIAFIAFRVIKKKSAPRVEFTDEEYEEHYELKMEGMEYVMGESYELVGHAFIPFDVGGAVDMYYFPNGIEGTGFATMELIYPDGCGPVKNSLGTYELVSFTRCSMSEEKGSDFSKIERRMCKVFTELGFYTKEAAQ